MATIVEWITPVTDRSEEDVNLVKQLNNYIQNPDDLWYNDLKGALNRSDLLRIGNNIGILLELVGEEIRFIHLYPQTDLYPNADLYPGSITYTPGEIVDTLYDPPELPTQSYYLLLQSYLERLEDYNYKLSTTPPIPSHPYNVYTKWNDIETFLRDMYSLVGAVLESYSYTGTELYCNNNLI